MAKLHEYLAIFQDRQKQAKVLVEESRRIFTNNRNLFVGSFKRVEAHDDRRSKELNAEESTKLTTTVYARLRYTLAKSMADILDITATIDNTNSNAKADLIIAGVVFKKDVPAITFLSLEKEFKMWLALAMELPTIQSGIPWELDPKQGEHIYRAESSVKKRTEKTSTAVVLYPHSDKHPAQVKEVINDVPVADILETTFSGMLSPEEKVQIIERIQLVIDGAKEGRTRANSVELSVMKLGDILMNYVLDGSVPSA